MVGSTCPPEQRRHRRGIGTRVRRGADDPEHRRRQPIAVVVGIEAEDQLDRAQQAELVVAVAH